MYSFCRHTFSTELYLCTCSDRTVNRWSKLKCQSFDQTEVKRIVNSRDLSLFVNWLDFLYSKRRSFLSSTFSRIIYIDLREKHSKLGVTDNWCPFSKKSRPAEKNFSKKNKQMRCEVSAWETFRFLLNLQFGFLRVCAFLVTSSPSSIFQRSEWQRKYRFFQ